MNTDGSTLSDFNWDSIPKYLVGGQYLPSEMTGQALGDAASGGLTSIGRTMSTAVDCAAHTPESLAVFLSRHIFHGKAAYRRDHHWWGRLYNKASGDHAYYIKLSGMHLVQVLNVIDQVPHDIEIPITAKCAVRLDFAHKILQELHSQIDARAK